MVTLHGYYVCEVKIPMLIRVCPPSTTLAQHWLNTGSNSMSRVSWDVVMLEGPVMWLTQILFTLFTTYLYCATSHIVGRICNKKCLVCAHSHKSMKICSIGLWTMLNSKLPGTTKSFHFFPPKSWKFKMAAMKYIFVSRIANNVSISMILVSKHMFLRLRKPISSLLKTLDNISTQKKKITCTKHKIFQVAITNKHK